MPVYYFVIEEDDVWRIRKKGRTYGGYLTREQALREAIRAAGQCAGEAHVVVQQPSLGYRIEWSNRMPAAAVMPTAMTEPKAHRLEVVHTRRPVFRRRPATPADGLPAMSAAEIADAAELD